MSRSQQYTDDLRLAHILADGVDRVSTMRFRDRPAFSPASEVVEPAEAAPAAAPLAPWQQATQQPAEPQAPVQEPADYASGVAQGVEELLHAQLSRVRTRDGIAGTHAGYNGQASRQWVIAPIAELDNFRRGVPVWATLIALLGRRWWAARGSGAYTGKSLAQATRLEVSSLIQLDQLSAAYTDLSSWKAAAEGAVDRSDELVQLLGCVGRSRAYGSFWAACMLAEGAVDTVVDASLSFYEVATLLPLIREAGGVASTLEGDLPKHAGLSVSGVHPVSLVASNTAAVQQQVLEALAPRP